jgi:hypothetical protein
MRAALRGGAHCAAIRPAAAAVAAVHHPLERVAHGH